MIEEGTARYIWCSVLTFLLIFFRLLPFPGKNPILLTKRAVYQRFHFLDSDNFQPNSVWLRDRTERDFDNCSSELCLLCNFTHRNREADSSSKDLVIGTMVGATFGVLPFVRTLRTTGCKATIVILADDKAISSMTTNHWKQLQGCCAHIISIGEWDQRIETSKLFFPIGDYIYHQRKHIDRVLITIFLMLCFRVIHFTNQ